MLDLIEGRMGIITMLNEECILPKGGDASFISKASSDDGCLIMLLMARSYHFDTIHTAAPPLPTVHP